ncbi:MAG: DUF512 domain-containing protein [Clostridia bacterium]|nr:DUF512 domain-containing protein [Clostridia bacterium]
MKHAIIQAVAPDSIAEEIGLAPGDAILKINGTEITDVLDYMFLTADDELEIEVLKADGEVEIIEVETDYEELGVVFENSLMDTPKSCHNKCIFCFIDQLPKGMRETVYFKDDDARLSFLQGNYITLTNLSDADIERIIRMRISPVNVSVHATEPELRKKMLNNRFAGNVYEIMQRLAENQITMNCQIVLCPEVNDGAHLDRTVRDLAALSPYVNSLSVVPVGLTRYREGLYPLKPFDAQRSAAVIAQVEGYQAEFLEKYGSRIVFLSDEFYLMADKPLPPASIYEDFYQIENGVGLIASMREEFYEALADVEMQSLDKTVSIATGEGAADFIRELADALMARVQGLNIQVFPIKNEFFGGGVNVSGLVVAGDIIKQLRGKKLGKHLYIPSSMLRADDDVFLDDITLEGLSDALSVPVCPVDNDGYQFIEKILGLEEKL